METNPAIPVSTLDLKNKIQLSDVLDIENIQRLQDLFSNATGVASIITDINGVAITKPSNFTRLCSEIIRKTDKGCTNCQKSDAIIGNYSSTGPVIQRCLSGGLWDAGASITVGDHHIANWLIGQVRNEETDIPTMMDYAAEIGVDEETFLEALNEVPIMSHKQLDDISKVLFVFASELSEKAFSNFQLKKKIIEQEKVTEALRLSEQRYRLLIETANEGVLVAQGDGLKFVNPMLIELTGYTEEEILSTPFLDFVYPDDRTLVKTNYLKRLNEEPIAPLYSFRLLKKDKSIQWVEMTGCKFDWEGQPATINFMTDISERKKAEQEILQKNEQLIKLIAEKDKFYSIIAHDLRSPFNSFLGLTQIMAEELPSLTMAEIQKIAESMRNSATNLFRLLENLLHWARMQQGLIVFSPEDLNLLAIINESIAMVKEPAKSKGVEIICDIPANIEILADSNLLQTVIRNIVSNALKFTPKGGKIVLSTLLNKDKSTQISIRDTGIGMSKAMVRDLFKIEVQNIRKGTEGEPSTGLGLLLCKEFISKHGGKIWVDSEEQKGSNFCFTIPANTSLIS